MKELIEVANNYAENKTNEVLTSAIAQAYADGYKDGYRDREEEIPVDIRFKKTEYVDLGLPSGTLWATCNVGACFPDNEGDRYVWGGDNRIFKTIFSQ